MRLLSLLLLTALTILADGGTVQLHRESGPFYVTVFSDLSVMLQSRSDLQPVLDAQVAIQLNDSAAVEATHAQAQNKLLYVAPFTLVGSGKQNYVVSIKNGMTQTSVSGVIELAQQHTQLATVWGYLVLPPMLIALFALRERLVHKRAGHLK